MNTRFFILALLVNVSVFADDKPRPAPLLQRLASTDFKVRRDASAELRTLKTAELQKLAAAATDQSSAEVAVRVLAEVENRYISRELEESIPAAEMLEQWRGGNRLLLSESAEQGFQLHWPQRVAMAGKALQDAGAVVKIGSFSQQAMWMPNRDRRVQIFLHEDWKGTDAHMAYFRRLAGHEESIGRMVVQIYLLDGHSVSDTQLATLGEIVGHSAIVERSRAALGIRGRAGFNDGVVIEGVTPGGSAMAAGLQRGDVLRAVVVAEGEDAADEEDGNKEIRLRSFDQLIQLLREYKVGDVVTFQVNRAGRPLTVEVKLKGWEDLETLE